MDVELKKLKKLIKLMRSEGVLELKQGDLVISLSTNSLFPKKTEIVTDDNPAIESQYTDEDLIDWSSNTAGLES